jgi:hypothetical protein
MPPQFGLIRHPAEAESFEFSVQRSGDGLAQGGLSHTGRADKAEDRRFGARVQLHHRQVFNYPFLYVLQAIVILVQHPAGVLQVKVIFRDGVPGEIEDQFHMRAGDLIFGGRRGNLLQTGEFLLHLFNDRIGELQVSNFFCSLANSALFGFVSPNSF